MADQNTPVSNFTDPLLDRFFLSPEEKASKRKREADHKGFLHSTDKFRTEYKYQS